MATRLSQWNKASPALVENRAANRYRVRVQTSGTLASDSDLHRALLHDVSTYGCRLALDAPLALGEAVTITLGTAAPIEARVVWVDNGMVGCRFAAPLARGLMRALTLGIHPVGGTDL